MADVKSSQVSETRQTGRPGGKAGSEGFQSVKDQATSSGRELKDKAENLAASSGEMLKEQASDLTEAAKDMASQATDKLKETMTESKGAGAAYIGNLAETMRRAAREFDQELPIAGKYIRKAAAQVDNVSDSIRTGDFNDLLDGARTFARRQPTAFMGLAALAGFATVRFLKSSPSSSSATGARMPRNQSHETRYENPGRLP